MSPRKVLIEADGGSRGNPGPAGYGAVVRDAGTGEVLAERFEAIGSTTNNVAEYRGLIAGLAAAAELDAAVVDVRMDSKLVVEQMSGRWQIKNAGLRPLAAEAATLARRFESVTYAWIPRERNRHADTLANAAMDAAAGKTPRATAGRAATEAAGPARDVAGPDSAARAQAREVAAQAAVAAGDRESAAAAGAAEVPSRAGSARPDPTGTPVRGSWEPRPGVAATRLVLVRHGATEYTAQRRYSGRGDVPLSDQGRHQARAAASRVAVLAPSVAAVVSSPLSRCTATAGILAGALGDPPVTVLDDLVECDYGDWEGCTFAEVRAEWPGELAAWLASPAVAPPGGESFAEVGARMRRAVRTLLRSYPGETVVLVSHVSPLKVALRDALAAGDSLLHRLYLDPAGISVVDTWPDGGVAVRTVNDTAHLAAD